MNKLRRIEVRRQKKEQHEPFLKRLRERVGWWPPTLAGGFFILATAIILYGQAPLPYWLGQKLQDPILARVSFEIIDNEGTAIARQIAREETPNYYRLNERSIERIRATIGNLYNATQAYESFEAYQQARQEALQQPDGQTADDPQWKLQEDGFNELHNMAAENGQTAFTAWSDALILKLQHERLVKVVEEQERGAPWKSNHAILHGATPNENDQIIDETALRVDKLSLDYFSNQKDVLDAADSLSQIFPRSIRDPVREILVGAMQREPLFEFDKSKTAEQMELAAKSKAEIRSQYQAGSILAQAPTTPDESIANPTGFYELSKEQLALLEAEHLHNQQILTSPYKLLKPADQIIRQKYYLKNIGLTALVFLTTLGMATYCSLFQTHTLKYPSRLLGTALLFLLMLAICRLGFLWTEAMIRFPLLAVAPVIITAAILTMVFSQRFALGMTSALILLITLTIRGDLSVLLVLTTTMAVAIFQLREIRSRNEFFFTGVLNSVVAFGVVLITGLIDGQLVSFLLIQAIMVATAAIVSIALLILFLSPIERIFKVATNWTLLELLDTSKPLLARLAREAPGTFAHSLWLGSMAEAACEAIGANKLLAKAGAMYHDIGKIHKSEYFAENQEARINRHDKLTPTMSLLVIVGHVKDGVELAKEEGLPPAITRFIEEHHGTTVVRYFHHAATERQKISGETREISETEFRYPGPKPQSKETAVLMLCDGVEGAVRVLNEPTAGRIETIVHNVLMDRLTDGQFDECDITLKDLHKVADSLVKTLCRFYHGRVAYPRAASLTTPEAQTNSAG